MKMEKVSEESNSFNLVFYGENQKPFLKFNIPIKEEGKLNLWLNFKPFFKD